MVFQWNQLFMSLAGALGSTTFSCAKFGRVKNLPCSFKQTCGINIDEISILFRGYTGEPAESPGGKQTKKKSTEHENFFGRQQQQVEID